MGKQFDKGGMLPLGKPVRNATGKPMPVGRVGSTGNSTGPHLHLEWPEPAESDGGKES